MIRSVISLSRPFSTHTAKRLASSMQAMDFGSAAANQLKVNFNKPSFYIDVAKLDPTHKEDWKKMANTAEAFLDNELNSLKPKNHQEAYDYSSNMRPTLQSWVINKVGSLEEAELATYAASGKLYQDFIKIHPQAFKQNGACSLFYQHPLLSAKILFAPIGTEVYTLSNVKMFIKAFGEGVMDKDFDSKKEVEDAIKAISEHAIIGDIDINK